MHAKITAMQAMSKQYGTSQMISEVNEHGQPIGFALPEWTGADHPGHRAMQGRYARLISLDPLAHTDDLFAAFSEDTTGRIWTYNFIGPFKTRLSLKHWIETAADQDEQPYFAVIDQDSGKAMGIASFLRLQPQAGVIEIGGITFAPALQRTRIASEAIFLMMQRAMGDLGYRRLEWKCDALNARSRAAASRFGFSFDGIFRHAAVYKGRNRDTAWYSLLDQDWPAVEAGFQAWLDPENFDAAGQQRHRLADLISNTRTTEEATSCPA